jgi:hypothetical protein
MQHDLIWQQAGRHADKPIALTTYVFGEQYHQYIPILLYSLLRAYPESLPIIFVKEVLSPSVRAALIPVEALGKFHIIERHHQELSFRTVEHGAAMRWFLWHDLFAEFEAIYTVDVDMLYAREEISIYRQHRAHADILGVPFSNMMRPPQTVSRGDLKYLARALWNGAYSHVTSVSVKSPMEMRRATGLHFVVTRPYYEEIRGVYEKFWPAVCSGRMFAHHRQGFSDESLLYDMLEVAGWVGQGEIIRGDTSIVSDGVLPPFRPHHGVHLGKFRRSDAFSFEVAKGLEQPQYTRYLLDAGEMIAETAFQEVLLALSPKVREQINCVAAVARGVRSGGVG